MSKNWKKRKAKGKPPIRHAEANGQQAPNRQDQYQRASGLAKNGQHDEARILLQQLGTTVTDARRKALIRNDLAALLTVGGDTQAGRNGFHEAITLDPGCAVARQNLAFLEKEAAANDLPKPTILSRAPPAIACQGSRVAIVSSLFNWPSTGGGIVHTVELAKFLALRGIEIRHIYARFDSWGLGKVEESLPYPSECLTFDEADWTVPTIQERFRKSVHAFQPDAVIVTDSWNFKPLLAEAVANFPYFLRLQAMECLCPLNNVRLLPGPDGQARQCVLHQLGHPQDCGKCLAERGRSSGGLHQAERALSGVGTPEYQERLLRVVEGAEAVLVVNALTAAMIAPYARDVRIVTSGMDPARFPWPWPDDPARRRSPKPLQIFFAGLIEEWMKGFNVLQEACALLWQHRRDFEVIATGDPPGRFNEFTRFIGWQSQEELPRHLRAADLLAMPTIAQEALGRTAVEAMGVGRPVVASSLGGLPFTVIDGETGLLCQAGNPVDLARKIENLLDDPGLRERMGLAGRKRFEEHYAWDGIIDRHYIPLLAKCRKRRSTIATERDS